MKTFARIAVVLLPLFLLCATVKAEDAKKDPPKKEEPKKDDTRKDDASKKDPKDMTLDELETAGICPVTKKPSKPIYHFTIDGKDFHFATRDAQKEFQADPAKFGYKKSDAKKEEPKKDEKK